MRCSAAAHGITERSPFLGLSYRVEHKLSVLLRRIGLFQDEFFIHM